VFRSKFSYSNSKSSYSDLLEDIESGNIESIFFYPRQREIDVLYKNGDKFKIPILYNDQLILEKATDNKYSKWVDNKGDEVKNVFGFNSSAELVNGRAAMIGFLMLLLTELVLKGKPVTSSIFGIN